MHASINGVNKTNEDANSDDAEKRPLSLFSVSSEILYTLLQLTQVFFFLSVLDLGCCSDFSPVVKSMGYVLVAGHVSKCSVFSCYGAWALEHRLGSCGAWA